MTRAASHTLTRTATRAVSRVITPALTPAAGYNFFLEKRNPECHS